MMSSEFCRDLSVYLAGDLPTKILVNSNNFLAFFVRFDIYSHV